MTTEEGTPMPAPIIRRFSPAQTWGPVARNRARLVAAWALLGLATIPCHPAVGRRVVFPVAPVRLVQTAGEFPLQSRVESVIPIPGIDVSVLDSSDAVAFRREVVLPGVITRDGSVRVLVGLSWLWRDFCGEGLNLQIIRPDSPPLPLARLGTDERLGLMVAELVPGGSKQIAEGIAILLSPDMDRSPDRRLVCVPGDGSFRMVTARKTGADSLRFDPPSLWNVPPLLLPVFTLDGKFDGFVRPETELDGDPAVWNFHQASEVLKTASAMAASRSDIRSAYLGVYLEDVVGASESPGVLVKGVEERSPARLAGIQMGDIIQEMNFKPARSSRHFIRDVQQLAPGERVSLSIRRGGQNRRVEAVLAPVPESREETATITMRIMDPSVTARRVLMLRDLPPFTELRGPRPSMGVFLRDLPPEMRRSTMWKGEGGVLVAYVLPGSPAETAGLRPGDLMVEIGGRPAMDAGEVLGFIRRSGIEKPMQVRVFRGGRTETVQIVPR